MSPTNQKKRQEISEPNRERGLEFLTTQHGFQLIPSIFILMLYLGFEFLYLYGIFLIRPSWKSTPGPPPGILVGWPTVLP